MYIFHSENDESCEPIPKDFAPIPKDFEFDVSRVKNNSLHALFPPKQCEIQNYTYGDLAQWMDYAVTLGDLSSNEECERIMSYLIFLIMSTVARLIEKNEKNNNFNKRNTIESIEAAKVNVYARVLFPEKVKARDLHETNVMFTFGHWKIRSDFQSKLTAFVKDHTKISVNERELTNCTIVESEESCTIFESLEWCDYNPLELEKLVEKKTPMKTRRTRMTETARRAKKMVEPVEQKKKKQTRSRQSTRTKQTAKKIVEPMEEKKQKETGSRKSKRTRRNKRKKIDDDDEDEPEPAKKKRRITKQGRKKGNEDDDGDDPDYKIDDEDDDGEDDEDVDEDDDEDESDGSDGSDEPQPAIKSGDNENESDSSENENDSDSSENESDEPLPPIKSGHNENDSDSNENESDNNNENEKANKSAENELDHSDLSATEDVIEDDSDIETVTKGKSDKNEIEDDDDEIDDENGDDDENVNVNVEISQDEESEYEYFDEKEKEVNEKVKRTYDGGTRYGTDDVDKVEHIKKDVVEDMTAGQRQQVTTVRDAPPTNSVSRREMAEGAYGSFSSRKRSLAYALHASTSHPNEYNGMKIAFYVGRINRVMTLKHGNIMCAGRTMMINRNLQYIATHEEPANAETKCLKISKKDLLFYRTGLATADTGRKSEHKDSGSKGLAIPCHSAGMILAEMFDCDKILPKFRRSVLDLVQKDGVYDMPARWYTKHFGRLPFQRSTKIATAKEWYDEIQIIRYGVYRNLLNGKIDLIRGTIDDKKVYQVLPTINSGQSSVFGWVKKDGKLSEFF